MKRIFSFVVAFIAIAQFLSFSDGAIITLDGQEPDLWSRGVCYLIVARVIDVETLQKTPNEDATHVLSMEPLFAIAGVFDPSHQSAIKVRAAIAKQGSWVNNVPPKGSIVLALIRPGNIGGDDARPFPCVAPEICEFMPDKPGLVVLKGVDDKRVQETLDRIRKARVAGEAEAKSAAKAAETQPATQPDPLF